jgi:copper oxidase (laccase) domain-containing protein
MDQDKMSKLYRGPSIDASYQVSVHLAEGFQRRRLKCEKLMDDGRQTTDVNNANAERLENQKVQNINTK